MRSSIRNYCFAGVLGAALTTIVRGVPTRYDGYLVGAVIVVMLTIVVLTVLMTPMKSLVQWSFQGRRSAFFVYCLGTLTLSCLVIFPVFVEFRAFYKFFAYLLAALSIAGILISFYELAKGRLASATFESQQSNAASAEPVARTD